MASGYRPTICSSGRLQPMAMVLQVYIPCEYGGVVLSHTSLQDDRLKVEYAPGQPRTAVAGSGQLTPHRYLLDRNGEPDKTLWQPGVIPATYQLRADADGTWSEQKAPYQQSSEANAETLPATTQGNINQYHPKTRESFVVPGGCGVCYWAERSNLHSAGTPSHSSYRR